MGTGIPTFQPPSVGGESRPSAAARGYGAAWQKRRKAFLRRHPVCQRCGVRPSAHADHVKRLTDLRPGEKETLQALCGPCHSILTVLHDGGLGRPKDENKPNFNGGGV